MPREQSPSMHEAHDEPGKPTQWELEFVLGELRAVEQRLQGQLDDLKRRLGSNPPDSAELKVRDWRVRAPAWAALLLAVLIVLAVAIWQAEDLSKILK
jgi:hypothetical protein